MSGVCVLIVVGVTWCWWRPLVSVVCLCVDCCRSDVVLVATSGDTGSAVAHAFSAVSGDDFISVTTDCV